MIIKDTSVKLDGVDWKMFRASIVVERVFGVFGLPLVITSANDGTHKPRNGNPSLHYVGLALDYRIHDAPPDKWADIRDAVEQRLGPDYVVILEAEPPHLHIQYRNYIDYRATLAEVIT